jgi:hypothetical protein
MATAVALHAVSSLKDPKKAFFWGKIALAIFCPPAAVAVELHSVRFCFFASRKLERGRASVEHLAPNCSRPARDAPRRVCRQTPPRLGYVGKRRSRARA